MTGRQIGADRGGTVTDVVARRPDGRFLVHEPLSDSSARGFDAPRVAHRNRSGACARRTGLPELPHERVVGLHERAAADGTVLHAPDLDGLAGLHCAHRHLHPVRRPELRAARVEATVRTSSPAAYQSSKPRAPEAAARRRPTPSSRRRDR
ncbi:hypothetical protein [Streptomyces sp. NPDC092370]|uniref:hypothetical protein n=1 Tax=Streptomyces sp. NPDC092370 TaxID=3366016 RepID=UPI00381CE95D